MIRSATEDDAEAICGIYNHYVRETVITFEEEPVSAEEMRNRVSEVTKTFPWLVYVTENRIVGYAYATLWKSRSAYRHTVESTVYVAPGFSGRGIGSGLYNALITELRERGVHAVVGIIALPNPVSIALHEKIGFEKAAHFKQVGRKFDQWIDVGYWQLIL